MTSTPGPITIALLADNERLIAAVGALRWREWGHDPEPSDRAWWVEVTAREAGRDELPVTWVAIDGRGEAIGAVGLGAVDLAERRDRPPWILGMIVRPDRRGQGVGGLLIAALEAWARAHGYRELWVATGGRAVDFYRRCGMAPHEIVPLAGGETATVLTKRC